VRFRFIEDRRAEYRVTVACSVLDGSRAGYYAWCSRPESRRSAANSALLDDIAIIINAMAARVSIANSRLRVGARVADASSA
jgi:hypothetical protein